jgi:hypothetical protein
MSAAHQPNDTNCPRTDPRQGPTPPASGALDFRYAFADIFDAELGKELLPVLAAALQLVTSALPPNDNLFSWPGNRHVLDGKSFLLEITTSTDERWRKILAEHNTFDLKHLDALTILEVDDNGKLPITTALFIDKLCYDENGNERVDSLVRIAVALAHEIFGNVQRELEFDSSCIASHSFGNAERIQREIFAFTAGVNFIERISSGANYLLLPKSIRDSFEQALVRERDSLRTWQQAL